MTQVTLQRSDGYRLPFTSLGKELHAWSLRSPSQACDSKAIVRAVILASRFMGLSINDSVYSCIFFFLTGLHFFHLVVGLLLLSLLSWSSTFPSHVYTFINLRISEVHLFYNLLNFYWHFLEILWLFIFLFLYSFFLLSLF